MGGSKLRKSSDLGLFGGSSRDLRPFELKY